MDRRRNTADPAPTLSQAALSQADQPQDDPPAEPDFAPEKGPLRRCIVTRAQGPREKMIRFVLGPERNVVPDLAARLPGRGLWLSARADVIETAAKRGAFARAARGPVVVPADLRTTLQAGLARRIADQLGFCRRAGQAVAGYAKAREWLEAGRVALVLQASDGSEDERRRLLSGARDITVGWPLDGAALGAVFGREQTVHVAVAPGALALGLTNELERLSGISGAPVFKQAGA